MNQIDFIQAMGALAQQTRLDIFRLLVQRGPDGVSAGEIADVSGIVAPTLSFHLTQLRNAGLVSYRRDGRSLFYSANFSTMDMLISYLTENCCGGRDELCAPHPIASKSKKRALARR